MYTTTHRIPNLSQKANNKKKQSQEIRTHPYPSNIRIRLHHPIPHIAINLVRLTLEHAHLLDIPTTQSLSHLPSFLSSFLSFSLFFSHQRITTFTSLKLKTSAPSIKTSNTAPQSQIESQPASKQANQPGEEQQEAERNATQPQSQIPQPPLSREQHAPNI